MDRLVQLVRKLGSGRKLEIHITREQCGDVYERCANKQEHLYGHDRGKVRLRDDIAASPARALA